MTGPHAKTLLKSKWVVRDDRRGTLRTALQEEITSAQDLLSDGELVHDERALHEWSQRRRGWRVTCAALLQREFAPEALEEFLRATAEHPRSGEPVARAMHCELQRVRNAIELLTSLRGTLSGYGAAAKAPEQAARREDESPAETQESQLARAYSAHGSGADGHE